MSLYIHDTHTYTPWEKLFLRWQHLAGLDMTFYKGCVKLPSQCPVSGIPAHLRVEASWMKDRFVRWGSPVLLLWGQTACVSPSCVLFPASAFVRAVTIWSSTQSSHHTASSHSHLEHCQRDLELSLCAPQGLMFLGRDLSPFLL